MTDYDIKIERLLKEGGKGNVKSEIWAEITNLDTGKTMKKRIWWKDDNGVFHDGTPGLSVNLRDAVDNAWIEQSRCW
ncbi:MAG: hypothetical protein KAV40_01255 [Thermoplasmatales archaeon]|nr:hypothetical protein [Thermoplasmatales archaeon]